MLHRAHSSSTPLNPRSSIHFASHPSTSNCPHALNLKYGPTTRVSIFFNTTPLIIVDLCVFAFCGMVSQIARIQRALHSAMRESSAPRGRCRTAFARQASCDMASPLPPAHHPMLTTCATSHPTAHLARNQCMQEMTGMFVV